MKILAVIPAFNAANSLPGLLHRIKSRIADILVVDDGSVDQTSSVALQTGVNVLRHKINKGKGAALKTGFASALVSSFDAVITIDADGQHDPDDIPRFIQAHADSCADVIIGSRRENKGGMPWPRRISNWSTSRILSSILNTEIEDSQCGYRLISRAVLESVKLDSDKFDLESEIIIKAVRAGFKIRFLHVKSNYDTASGSHIRPLIDTIRWCRMMLKTH